MEQAVAAGSPFVGAAEDMDVHTSHAQAEVRDIDPGVAAATFALVPVPQGLEKQVESAHDYLGQQLVRRLIRMDRSRPC